MNPDKRYDLIAETGFQYYRENAQALLPWLIKLVRHGDLETRESAYEAAFFTRPDKEIFLLLADHALKEKPARYEECVAQWMTEQFPDEAQKRHLVISRPPKAGSLQTGK